MSNNSEQPVYPGEKCGLSEDEWALEIMVDKIKELPTLEAMGFLRRLGEIAAKQEAIEFAEYINGCGYIEYDGYDRWHSPTMSTEVLSTSQLYQLFINSKTK